MKKVIGVMASLALAGFAFADEDISISLSNELGSDVVTVTEDNTKFSGIYNEVVFDLESPYIDAGLDIKPYTSLDEDGDIAGLAYDEDKFDWYAVLKPNKYFQLGLSAAYNARGSYLVIEDDNMASGALGSDGVTLAFTGLEGFTFTATAPLVDYETNWFNSKSQHNFNLGFGAEYSNDYFALGGNVKDVFTKDDTTFGVYANVNPLEGLSLFGGYGYKDGDATLVGPEDASDEDKDKIYVGLCDVYGKHKGMFSAIYENGPCILACDYIGSGDMFYSALKVDYGITDIITASVTGVYNRVFDEDDLPYTEFNAQNTVTIKPAVVLNLDDHHEIQIEADLTINNDDGFEELCFPVYWKYTF